MLKMIVMDRIHRNWELNPRVKNDVFIDDLSEIIAKDGYDKDKPCTVFEIEGHDLLELACGHHRFEANQKAGNTEIWCEVRQGTLEDLIDTMCEDNQQFDPAGNPKLGQLWTSTEKREAGKLRLLLPKYFAMSDRELAPIFGMDHHATIGRWRRDVVSVAIATSENPYNIEEPRLTELRELVAKREEQNKNRTGPKPKADQPAATQPAATPHANGEHRAIEKANFELDRARENTRASAAELKTVWGNAGFNIKYSEFLEFVSKAYDFELETLRAICFTLSVPGGFSTFNGLSMSELGTWRSRLNSLKGAIERKDPAFAELREKRPEDELELAREAYIDAHTDMWHALGKSKYEEYVYKDDFISAACKPFNSSAFPDAFNLHNVDQLEKWRNRIESVILAVKEEADDGWFMKLVSKSKQAILDTVGEYHQAQNRIYDVWSNDDIIRDRFETVEDFQAALIKERELWTGIFNRVDPENLDHELSLLRRHITKLDALADDLENEADWVLKAFYSLEEASAYFTRAHNDLQAAYQASELPENGVSCQDFLDAASNGFHINRPWRVANVPPTDERFKDWTIFNFTSWAKDINELIKVFEDKPQWFMDLIPAETDSDEAAAETEHPRVQVGTLQKKWHEVRDAMFAAFKASPLSGIEGTQDHTNALAAFISKIESRNPGMDVYSSPTGRGVRGNPGQVNGLKRETAIYEQITADIESEAEWVLNVLTPFSEQPFPGRVFKCDDPNDTKVRFCISIPKGGGFSHEVLWETYFEMPRDYDDIERRDKACRRGFELMKELLGVK